MTEFRLTQISDPHLARRLTKLTANFDAVSDYIDATRPDLVVTQATLRSTLRRTWTIWSLREPCTMLCRLPAATCRATTTSATIRPKSAPPPRIL